jgi:hypothetical protein
MKMAAATTSKKEVFGHIMSRREGREMSQRISAPAFARALAKAQGAATARRIIEEGARVSADHAAFYRQALGALPKPVK